MQRFDAAPWPVSLRVVSTIATLVLGGVACVLYGTIPRATRVPFAETFGTFMPVVPAAIVVGALLFIVRGYELDGTGLYVELPRQMKVELDVVAAILQVPLNLLVGAVLSEYVSRDRIAELGQLAENYRASRGE